MKSFKYNNLLSKAVSRYPAAGNCFQKTRYPAVRNFDQFSRSRSFKFSFCLEITSVGKYRLGLKVEATVELGHRVKSQCFRHLENMQVLTH